jgi:hypothetical protein
VEKVPRELGCSGLVVLGEISEHGVKVHGGGPATRESAGTTTRLDHLGQSPIRAVSCPAVGAELVCSADAGSTGPAGHFAQLALVAVWPGKELASLLSRKVELIAAKNLPEEGRCPLHQNPIPGHGLPDLEASVPPATDDEPWGVGAVPSLVDSV